MRSSSVRFGGILLLVLLIMFCAMPAFSQDPPDFAVGATPSTVYNVGNIDGVDMISGRLNVHIPMLVDSSQRGNLNFTYEVYNISSAFWYVNCTDPGHLAGCLWHLGKSTGRGLAFAANGAIYGGSESERLCCFGNAGNYATFYVSEAVDSSGPVHQLGTTSFGAESIDGSGIRSGVDSNNLPFFTRNDGVQFHLTGSAAPYGSIVEDANGNQLTTSPVSPNTLASKFGVFYFVATSAERTIDTLGRTWSWTGTTDYSNCPVTAVAAYIWSTPGLSGGTRNFKFCMSSIPIATNFHLLLGTQYVPEITGTSTALTGVVLPDLTTWRFDYTSYGDVAKIYLPSGGTITYTWGNVGVGGCTFTSNVGVDYSRGVVTRAVYDGANTNTWHYNIGPGNTNTVTDPLNNDTDYSFDSCGGYINSVQKYSGTGSGRSLLSTTTTNYITPPDPYSDDLDILMAPQLPSSVVTAIKVGQNTKVSQASYTYDSGFSFQDTNMYAPDGPGPFNGLYGLVQTESQTDWNTNTAGGVLSNKNTTYLALSNAPNASQYLTANLLTYPYIQTVTNINGYLCSEADYGYDESAVDPSGVTQQHTTPPNSVRANLTSVKRQLFSSPATPCSSASPSKTAITTTNHIYDTGRIHTSTDPLNHSPKTYTYSGTYYGAYPTTVCNSLSQCTNSGYDFNTGLLTSLQDPNSQTTTFSWDNMLRATQANYADGGQKTFTPIYSSGYFTSGTLTQKVTSSLTNARTTSYDGLGKEIQTKATVPTATCAAGYSYVDTSYDALGRKKTVSNPDCTSGSSDDVNTTYNYDPLDRITSVVEQDGGSITTDYSTFPCIVVTDEAVKARKSCSDGLGRLTGVWEDPNGLNYNTNYTYDSLGNLLSVLQSNSRQRTFTYDSLSRLTSSINPESNTVPGTQTTVATTYSYDADSNLSSKTEPAPNQAGASTVTVSYCYDAINRMSSKAYTLQSCPMTSPIASYTYDAADCQGQSPCYNVGHRTGMSDAAGSGAWSYDKMGRAAVDKRTTNSVIKSTIYATPSVPYNYDGSIAQLTYPSQRIITYTPDIAFHQISAIDVANSTNYAVGPSICPNGQAATGACYTPQGSLASVKNGSAFVSVDYYNTRMQPCRMSVNGTGTAPTSCTDGTNKGDIMDFSFDFHAGAGDNGNVYKISNNRLNAGDRNINYGYDSLNRMSYAYTDGNLWGETYSIDTWGNLSGIGNYTGKPAGETLSQGVNSSNQLMNACSSNCYDSAGNLLNDGAHSYTYDAEGHTLTAAGVTYYYDGDGKRVRKSNGALYWYGVGSDALDETDASGNVTNEYIFLGGKRIARRDSSSNIFYYFTDHLGTSRSIVQSGQTTPCYDEDFYPYGREVPHTSEIPAFVNTCPQNYKFTGKERDSESNLDNFGARYDSSQYGRFMTPDPMGGKAAFPQTWNAYAYVGNNPLNSIDPTGLDCVYLNNSGNGIESIDNQSSAGECQRTGGAWANGTITQAAYDPNSNDVLLGYANKDSNGNIQYSQVTATPGQFSPGNELDAVAAGVNASNPQGFINAVGTLMPLGGAAAYGGIAVAGTYGVGTLTTGVATTVGGTAGPLVTDPKLQALVEELFQATDRLPGGTAGAVNYEARTGDLLSPAGHFQKAGELLGHLNDMIRSGDLSVHDQVVAKGLAQNLSDSLGVARAQGAIK